MNILKDSSFYQLILNEGLEKGRKEGRKEGRQEGRQEGLGQGERKGRIAEARAVLFRLGRIRFGRLDKATRSVIENLDDLNRLEHLTERLLTATSWADLLAESG